MSDKIRSLINSVKNQNFQSLARLLSELESAGGKAISWQKMMKTKHQALRIGITGPPGAGKSTLISALIEELRRRGLSVAVLAVDPSSPFTKGAILGDRIRFAKHFTDSQVFVRSIGSRGSLGGLSASAYMMVRAFDLAKFDVVLVETVGVGQTELEIMNVADYVAVVLVPESGDSVQAMKAGLLEIADLFVVNKADRPGAESMVRFLNEEIDLHNQLVGESDSRDVRVMSTVASESRGVLALVDYLLGVFSQSADREKILARRNSRERKLAETKALLRAKYEERIEREITKIK